MSRYDYDYSFYPWQTAKWEKAEKAARTIARPTKKNCALSSVPGSSGHIAKTFWGKARQRPSWAERLRAMR